MRLTRCLCLCAFMALTACDGSLDGTAGDASHTTGDLGIRDLGVSDLDVNDQDMNAPLDASTDVDATTAMDASALDMGTVGTDLGSGCPALTRNDRAMWLWDTDPITDTGARADMFSFASAHGIRLLYMNALNIVSGSSTRQGQLASFVVDAHAACFYVEFVFGRTAFLLPDDSDEETLDRSDLYAEIDALGSFIAAHPESRPDAVHLDVEPHGQRPQWTDDENGTANQWLDVIEAVDDMAGAMGLDVNVDIPRWYDGVDVTRASMTRPLSEWTIDAVDHIAIMDYSNSVTTIVNDARDELDYAASVGKSVVIGVEIGCADPATETVSFWLQGPSAMSDAIDSANTMLSSSTAVERFAVHDYQHYILSVDPPGELPECPECGEGGFCNP